MPAPQIMPENTSQLSETLFSVSYFRIDDINRFCKTDEVARKRHNIRNRNKMVGKWR